MDYLPKLKKEILDLQENCKLQKFSKGAFATYKGPLQIAK